MRITPPANSPKPDQIIIQTRSCGRVDSLNNIMLTTSTIRYQSRRPKTLIKQSVHSPRRSSAELLYDIPSSSLTRSKSRLHMTLKEDMYSPRDKPNSKLPEIDLAMKELCDKLKQQVSDLSLFLEEERLLHRETRRKAEDYLRDRVEQMNRDHEEELHKQSESHIELIELIKSEQSDKISDIKSEYHEVIGKLKTELEIITSAFHTYRSQTEIDMNQEYKEKCAQLTEQLKQEYQQKLTSERSRIEREFEHRVSVAENSHQLTVDKIRKACQNQLDMARRKYANHESDLVALSNAQKQIKTLKAEVVEKDKEIEQISSDLNRSTNKHTDTKLQLMALERDFGNRLARANENLKTQMDDLRENNSQLRVKYLKKCEELFDKVADCAISDQEKVRAQQQLVQMLGRLTRSQTLPTTSSISRLNGNGRQTLKSKQLAFL